MSENANEVPDVSEALKGWCKNCAEVRDLDRELGRCGDCGSPHVSPWRPVELRPVAEAA